jgi:hypothetical protein
MQIAFARSKEGGRRVAEECESVFCMSTAGTHKETFSALFPCYCYSLALVQFCVFISLLGQKIIL